MLLSLRIGKWLNPSKFKRKGEFDMLITKKMLLALTLVAALIGGGVGALVTHSTSADNTKAANTNYDANQTANQLNQTDKTPDQVAIENSARFKTSEEQAAYRQGFDEGYSGCTTAQTSTSSSRSVAYYRTPVRSYYNGRRVYYDYGTTRGRS